jgi:hypothetical protein
VGLVWGTSFLVDDSQPSSLLTRVQRIRAEYVFVFPHAVLMVGAWHNGYTRFAREVTVTNPFEKKCPGPPWITPDDVIAMYLLKLVRGALDSGQLWGLLPSEPR